MPRRFAIIAILLTAALTALAFRGLPLQERDVWEGDLPPDDPVVLQNTHFEDVFGQREVALLLAEGLDFYSPKGIQAIHALSEDLNAYPYADPEATASLTHVKVPRDVDDMLQMGAFVQKLPRTAAEAAVIREAARAEPLIHGRLVSRDGRTALVSSSLVPGYDPAQHFDDMQALAQRHSHGGLQVTPYTRAVFNHYIDLGVERNIRVLAPIALGLVLIGYYFSTRTLRGFLAAIASLVLAIVWAYGFAGLGGLKLNALTSVLPLVLIVIGSSYTIHVVHFWRREGSVDGMYRRIGSAILVAGGTTAAGFGSLLAFRIVSIREFGIMVTLGVLALLWLNLAFVPAILVLLPGRSGRRVFAPLLERPVTGLIRAFVGLSRTQRVLAGICVAAVSAWALLGLLRLKVGSEPIQLVPPDHVMRRVTTTLNDDLGGWNRLSVMLTTPKADGVPKAAVMRAIGEFERAAAGLKHVGHTTSLGGLLESAARAAHVKWPPDNDREAAQIYLAYEMSVDPLVLERVLDLGGQSTRIDLWVTTQDSEELAGLIRKVDALARRHLAPVGQYLLGGRIVTWIAQNAYVVQGKLLNIVLALLVAFLICMARFRSPVRGALVLPPILISTLWVFGIMGWVGWRLEFATACITGVTVGVGIDFGIHLLAALEYIAADSADDPLAIARNALTQSGPPILYDALSNCIGFSVFLLSDFPPLRILGGLGAITMVLCAGGAMLFVPPLWVWVRRRQVAARRAPAFASGLAPAPSPSSTDS